MVIYPSFFSGGHFSGDEPDRENEHYGGDQVGELTDVVGICADGDQFDQYFDKFDGEAGDRSHCEKSDHGRDVTEVDLVEDRHQRHGELQGHEDAGEADESDQIRFQTSSGNYHLALSRGVYSNHLQDPHTYSVSDGTNTYTITASVLTYARSCALKTEKKVSDLGKALYLYSRAVFDAFEG